MKNFGELPCGINVMFSGTGRLNVHIVTIFYLHNTTSMLKAYMHIVTIFYMHTVTIFYLHNST